MKLASLFTFLPLLVACSAETSSAPDTSEPNEPTESNGSTETAPSRATFAFQPSEVHARRSPVGARCGETNAPFTDEDIFTLQAVNASAPNGVASVAVSFTRTAPKGVDTELAPGQPPSSGTTFEGVDISAGTADGKTEITVLPSPKGPAKPIAKAKVRVVELPTKDGESMTARVTIDFVDGDVLDEPFTGTLVSSRGACGGGG